MVLVNGTEYRGGKTIPGLLFLRFSCINVPFERGFSGSRIAACLSEAERPSEFGNPRKNRHENGLRRLSRRTSFGRFSSYEGRKVDEIRYMNIRDCMGSEFRSFSPDSYGFLAPF